MTFVTSNIFFVVIHFSSFSFIIAEPYLESCQASKMESLTKLDQSFELFFFLKSPSYLPDRVLNTPLHCMFREQIKARSLPQISGFMLACLPPQVLLRQFISKFPEKKEVLTLYAKYKKSELKTLCM